MLHVDLFGYLAGLCLLLMASMKTQTQMRAFNIAGNIFFVAYGFLADLMPVLILNAILIGLHVYRLAQIRMRRTA